MSSFRTHLLIGAVGGLALAKTTSVLEYIPLQQAPATLMLIVGSAVLADWPDIDEPGSWISRHVRGAISVLTSVLFLLLAVVLAPSVTPQLHPLIIGAGAALGGLLVVGPLVGRSVLHGIRYGAGGHRRLTHSFVLGAILAGGAYMLWQWSYSVWGIVFGSLAWGLGLHVIGDIVTVAGVPLLFPFSHKRVGLPLRIARYGEVLVTCAALGIGYLLLRL